MSLTLLPTLWLTLVFCATMPLLVRAQTPEPTIPTEASESPEVQALDNEFLVLWPTLLRGDFKTGLPALESLLQRCQAKLGVTAPTTLKVQYFLA